MPAPDARGRLIPVTTDLRLHAAHRRSMFLDMRAPHIPSVEPLVPPRHAGLVARAAIAVWAAGAALVAAYALVA